MLVQLAMAGTGLMAPAQSAEPTEPRLELGQPLAVDLPVRDVDTGPRLLVRECVDVTLQQGDRPWPVARLHWQVRTAADTDRTWQISVRSDERIEEPIVRARITLRCGVPYTREFTLLAEPAPSDLPTLTPFERPSVPPALTHPARVDTASEAVPPPAASRSTHRPAPRSSLSGTAPAQTRPMVQAQAHTRNSPPHTAPVRPERAASAAPPVVSPVARLQLDDLLEAQPPGAIPTTLAFSPALRPADARLHDALQSLWLKELQILHEEQRLMRLTLARLDARLAQEGPALRWPWLPWLLLGFGMVWAATLSAWLRDTLLRRWTEWHDNTGTPVRRPAARMPDRDVPTTPQASTDTTATTATTATTTLPQDAALQATAAAAPTDTAATTLPWLPLSDMEGAAALRTPQAATGTDQGDATAPVPALAVHRRAGAAQRGGLDEPPTSPALAQIDTWINKGFSGAAAAALEATLQTRAGPPNPWVLLRLLDLYRSLAQPWNHERVSADLEALYNVRVPPCNEQPGEGRSLEEHTLAWPRVCRLWQEPDAADQLASLLLRPTRLEVLDLAAFRDTLMLYAMSTQALGDPPDPMSTPIADPPLAPLAEPLQFDWSGVGLRT